MAIHKKFIHFKTFANFNSQKLSANEQDNQYTLGINGEIQNGSPTILYNSICYIKDTKQQWTHGQLYDCGGTSNTKEPFYFEVSDIDNLTYTCRDFTNLINAFKEERPIFLRFDTTHSLDERYVVPVSMIYNEIHLALSFIYYDSIYKIDYEVDTETNAYCSIDQTVTIIPINSIYSKPNAGIPKTDLSSDVQALLDDSNIVFIDVPLDDIDFEEDGFGSLDIGLIQFTLQEDYDSLKQAIIDGKQLAILYSITSDISTPTYLYDLWIDDMIYGKIAHPYTGMIYDVEISLGGISFSKVAKVTSNGISAKNLYFEENDNSSISIKEALSRKQDKLTSGTNIKTINGTSILGSGDITISGGSGTITEVKANGTSIATSGVANIPAASTSAYGVTKLSSATNSTSTTLAATASAVKAAYDLANNYKGTVTGVKVNGSTKSPSSGTVDIGNVATSIKINGTTKSPSSGVVDLGTVITAHQDISGKQDTLISGTNIKTINGTTILGSGDITISGGSSTTRMQFVVPAANISIPMNTVKVITSVTSTNQTFTLGTSSIIRDPASITQEQKFEIVFAISGSLSTAPTITFNTGSVGTIYWINGEAPTFEVGKFYEVSFLNAGGILLGVCAEFSAS